MVASGKWRFQALRASRGDAAKPFEMACNDGHKLVCTRRDGGGRDRTDIVDLPGWIREMNERNADHRQPLVGLLQSLFETPNEDAMPRVRHGSVVFDLNCSRTPH